MRIAFVLGSFPVLSQTFVLNQITGLLDLGHEVDIYSQSGGDHAGRVHPDVEKYELLDKTRYIFRRGSSNPLSRVLRVSRTFTDVLKEAPSLAPAALAACVRERSTSPLYVFRQLTDRPYYDIVQCHFGYTCPVGVLFKRIGLAKGVVVTFHAHELTNKLTPRHARLYREWSREVDLLTPISYLWQDQLISLGCPEEKILVHRMAVDLERFQYRSQPPRDSLRLLTVARLVEKKGIEYAIRAVGILKERYPEKSITLNVVGDGELRRPLEALRNALGLQDNVRFMGWLDQEQVRAEMIASHVFVLPSVTARDGGKEGVPVSLMEAMATGVPVVSTRHSGIPELVQDGESGFLTDEQDPEALAERIARFVEFPSLATRMGRAGREFVETHHNIETLNLRLEAIYRHILRGAEFSEFREPIGAVSDQDPEIAVSG